MTGTNESTTSNKTGYGWGIWKKQKEVEGEPGILNNSASPWETPQPVYQPRLKNKVGIDGLTLQSLIATLTELRAVRGPMVNDNTLFLFCEVLKFADGTIASGVKATSDAEVLLDFLLCVRYCVKLASQIVSFKDANRKARRLMFKLVSKTDVMPRSLFITDVEKDSQAIAVGGFGKIFKGKCGGQLVALEMLYHGHHRDPGDSTKKEFYTEALAWRSLSHRFILPLLGIYEEGPQLFFVSSFMTNGALHEWRRQHAPVRINEIQRLLLEVAEGVQYIHSEGIVHGDLHPGNVLLDSEFHCQITDFGSTRHSEATVIRSTTALIYNYAAPELFGMCTTCCQFDCDGSHGDQDEQHRTKTMKTDVYAFGCLYYAIFFDTVPFHGKNDLNILRLFTKGVRPDRLKDPIMEDFMWDLIQRCWKSNPSERPTMKEIVTVFQRGKRIQPETSEPGALFGSLSPPLPSTTVSPSPTTTTTLYSRERQPPSPLVLYDSDNPATYPSMGIYQNGVHSLSQIKPAMLDDLPVFQVFQRGKKKQPETSEKRTLFGRLFYRWKKKKPEMVEQTSPPLLRYDPDDPATFPSPPMYHNGGSQADLWQNLPYAGSAEPGLSSLSLTSTDLWRNLPYSGLAEQF